jgi:predicted nucleotidyltransferase component of viral defense system
MEDCMNLHKDEEAFRNLVTLASQKLGIREVFIEKDYWVTFALKRLSESIYKDKIVFKGGTSLSKVYKLIFRFSEDIDLAYIDQDVTRSKRKRDFEQIDKEITKSPFIDFTHEDEKKGPQFFRKTFHTYPRLIKNTDFGEASDKLILEINSFAEPSPYKVMVISSYIYDFLNETKQIDVISEFQLETFEVNVLHKSKTLAEKLCGLAKYTNTEDVDDFEYLKTKIRHIYDISKLLDDDELKNYVLTDEFVQLVLSVRKEDSDTFRGETWTTKKFSEAKIYSETDTVLDKIKDSYNNEFSSLLYSKEILPELTHVSGQIKTIYKQLKKVDTLFGEILKGIRK